jgi:hypothetical protein
VPFVAYMGFAMVVAVKTAAQKRVVNHIMKTLISCNTHI